MADDPDKPSGPGPGDLETPFLFVPHGAPEPTEWMRKHPGWVKFPATFVPRTPGAVRTIPGTNRPWPLDKRGQPWPRSRFGQPLRPLDEYPPGVRAPGEGYTGPIADPKEAMRVALASGDMLAQAAKFAADPDAPIRAYLSAMEVWKNPAKYALHPRAEALASARAPSPAEQDADAIRAGMDRARAAGRGGGTKVAQVVLPLPVPPPSGRMTDAVPPAGQPGMAEEVARVGRRLRHVGGEIGRGDLAGAAGHLLLGRPFPEAVDDPALAAMRAAPLRPSATRGDVVLNQNSNEDGQPDTANPGASGQMHPAKNATGDVGTSGPAQRPIAEVAFPDRPLPRDSKHRTPIPDIEAGGPYTQLGTKEGRRGSYPQAREFDAEGKPVRDIDFTDHGRPDLHTNPHQHRYKPNKTGGTLERGDQEPME